MFFASCTLGHVTVSRGGAVHDLDVVVQARRRPPDVAPAVFTAVPRREGGTTFGNGSGPHLVAICVRLRIALRVGRLVVALYDVLVVTYFFLGFWASSYQRSNLFPQILVHTPDHVGLRSSCPTCWCSVPSLFWGELSWFLCPLFMGSLVVRPAFGVWQRCSGLFCGRLACWQFEFVKRYIQDQRMPHSIADRITRPIPPCCLLPLSLHTLAHTDTH